MEITPRLGQSGRKPHRGHDVFGIGGQLFLREGDRARHTRGGRRGFEMTTRRRRREHRQRLMMRFERAHHRSPAPGPQHGKNEFGRMTLRENHRRVVRAGGVSDSRSNCANVQLRPEARSRKATSLPLSRTTFCQHS